MNAKYVAIWNKVGLLHEATIAAVSWQDYKNSEHKAQVRINDKPASVRAQDLSRELLVVTEIRSVSVRDEENSRDVFWSLKFDCKKKKK
jgi:GTP cyclohydrolase II